LIELKFILVSFGMWIGTSNPSIIIIEHIF